MPLTAQSPKTVLLWRGVGSFYLVALSGKLGQKGQVAVDLGSAETHPLCLGPAELYRLCEAACSASRPVIVVL